ncbi:MAG: hypothetical protein E4H00_02770 [Myxococcales bacterium]|nr:MAG: hypothetical protein E4H00_02770 [Myxococcales bacterium]
MNLRPSAADEGLLYAAERWTPADAELWGRWRQSLRAEHRTDALLPLQAVLSGLVAFRHLENHSLSMPVTDFRPHLHAVHVAYDWALELVEQLRNDDEPARPLQSVRAPLGEPQSSLRSLERSLMDARRVSARLLELPVVDAGAFQSSNDLFRRDLARNEFFEPPEPLEFSNVAELMSPEGLTPELQSWKSTAAKMTTMLAFLTLLRAHRFLGIADRQIGEDDGLYRGHVVVASVRRELRTLTRFLLVQGVETFADELEARLFSFDAHHITGAREEITKASSELTELRESVEALAMELHSTVRTALDGALPEVDPQNGYALPAERMRSGIREVRATVKDAAKQLRGLGRPTRTPRTERKSERVRKNDQQDIWAFRFILRAFVAKASVASVGADDWSDTGSLEFVGEFVRHFRLFGPRLTRATDYSRRGPLTRALSPLSRREAIDAASLSLATNECILFLKHLDEALAELPQSMLAPFDKSKAAAQLRGYLAAAKDRSASDRAAAGAFGLTA